MSNSFQPTGNDELDRVIASFLRAVERGDTPDREELINEQPRFEVELRAFFADLDGLPNVDGEEATEEFSSSDEASRVIGNYELVQKIGSGGMGEVWVAKQSKPVKRRVALKLIKAGMDSKQVVSRFEAERQALAAIDHPNVAKVLDAGTTPSGQPFFVMELVNGAPLTKYCDEAKLSVQERLELMVQIASAVQHAHHKGIVHRDLKPANILVTVIDGKPVPKIIDFGLAKALGGRLTEESFATHFGSVMGTLEYMAPEQAGYSGQDVDTRADIYSLGVILYELLTGLLPFDSSRLRQAALDEMLRIIREEEPARPSLRLTSSESAPSYAAVRRSEPKQLAGLLRSELDWIVMKSLDKDRNRRYETASSFSQDISRYLIGDTIQAHPPTLAYRLRKFARRNYSLVASISAILVGILIAVVSLAYGLKTANTEMLKAVKAESEAKEQRDEANRQRAVAEDLLIQGILRPIGVTDELTTAELGSFIAWSQIADDQTRLMVLEQALADPDVCTRIFKRATRIVQATVGISSVRRSRAIELAHRRATDMEVSPVQRIAAAWVLVELGATKIPLFEDDFITSAEHAELEGLPTALSNLATKRSDSRLATQTARLAIPVIESVESHGNYRIATECELAISQLVALLESGTILQVWDRLVIQERLVGNGVFKDPLFSELIPAISDAVSDSGWSDAVGHFVEQARTPKADSYGGEYYSEDAAAFFAKAQSEIPSSVLHENYSKIREIVRNRTPISPYAARCLFPVIGKESVESVEGLWSDLIAGMKDADSDNMFGMKDAGSEAYMQTMSKLAINLTPRQCEAAWRSTLKLQPDLLTHLAAFERLGRPLARLCERIPIDTAGAFVHDYVEIIATDNSDVKHWEDTIPLAMYASVPDAKMLFNEYRSRLIQIVTSDGEATFERGLSLVVSRMSREDRREALSSSFRILEDWPEDEDAAFELGSPSRVGQVLSFLFDFADDSAKELLSRLLSVDCSSGAKSECQKPVLMAMEELLIEGRLGRKDILSLRSYLVQVLQKTEDRRTLAPISRMLHAIAGSQHIEPEGMCDELIGLIVNGSLKHSDQYWATKRGVCTLLDRNSTRRLQEIATELTVALDKADIFQAQEPLVAILNEAHSRLPNNLRTRIAEDLAAQISESDEYSECSDEIEMLVPLVADLPKSLVETCWKQIVAVANVQDGEWWDWDKDGGVGHCLILLAHHLSEDTKVETIRLMLNSLSKADVDWIDLDFNETIFSDAFELLSPNVGDKLAKDFLRSEMDRRAGNWELIPSMISRAAIRELDSTRSVVDLLDHPCCVKEIREWLLMRADELANHNGNQAITGNFKFKDVNTRISDEELLVVKELRRFRSIADFEAWLASNGTSSSN